MKFNEEKFLKTLFNEAGEEPSIGFEKLLMLKVEQAKQKNKFICAPTLGWKGWSVFAACFLALLIFALSSKMQSSYLSYDQIAQLNGIVSSMNSLHAAPLIYIGVVASAILILLDFFISKKRRI